MIEGFACLRASGRWHVKTKNERESSRGIQTISNLILRSPGICRKIRDLHPSDLR